MALKIIQIGKSKNSEIEHWIKGKYRQHIIKHFSLNSSKINCRLTINISNKSVSLHYHNEKEFHHFYVSKMTVWHAVIHAMEELERKIKKERNNRSAIHQKHQYILYGNGIISSR